MENTIKEINGTSYSLKYFPTMTGLEIVSKMERNGMTPELIFDVISRGASIGSVGIDRKKFDTHFRGKYAEIMELLAEILKFNNLFPEEQSDLDNEGNQDGSVE